MNIDYKQHKFVVIGAGDTGRAIVNFIRARGGQILRVLDTRANPPQLDQLPIIGGALDYTNLSTADVIVISPGVSIYEPVLQLAIRQNKAVVGDIELFAQEIASWPSKVIGVSGSNGKTTVTSLTGFLASQVGISTLVAGNIGKQVLEAVLEIEASGNYPELIVLELSSFQLETTQSLKLISATVLNISEDHLDRYRDLLEYAYNKAHIFQNCAAQVLNQNDPLVMAMANQQRQYLFGTENAAFSLDTRQGQLYLQVDGKDYINTAELQLLGRHNYLNCLASLALLAAAGYELTQFKSALSQFCGLEHRMQKVTEHKQVLYIEDSKGTNVGAVIAGVGGIDRPVHLILGGDGKGQDFTPLRELVLRKCKSVAIIGQDSAAIAAVLSDIPQVELCSSLKQAIYTCVAKAEPGDAVILSPACASWDMFSNYKQRAQVFIDTVYAATQKSL